MLTGQKGSIRNANRAITMLKKLMRDTEEANIVLPKKDASKLIEYFSALINNQQSQGKDQWRYASQ